MSYITQISLSLSLFQAQAVTLTVAQAFKVAFEFWQNTKEGMISVISFSISCVMNSSCPFCSLFLTFNLILVLPLNKRSHV